MAKNINPLKRLEVKYVRDGIKSRYKLKTECEICGTTEELENHHYKLHSVYGKEPPLFTASKQINWVSKQKEKLIDVVK